MDDSESRDDTPRLWTKLWQDRIGRTVALACSSVVFEADGVEVDRVLGKRLRIRNV